MPKEIKVPSLDWCEYSTTKSSNSDPVGVRSNSTRYLFKISPEGSSAVQLTCIEAESGSSDCTKGAKNPRIVAITCIIQLKHQTIYTLTPIQVILYCV